MKSNKAIFLTQKVGKLLAAILCSGLVTACSGGSGGIDFAESIEPEDPGLSSCADDDSCFSNPTLEIGGDRLARVSIPSDYNTATRYPLIIVLHGIGFSGAIQAAYLGLDDRVDSHQYVLVAPDGTENEEGDRFWNATPACCAFFEGDTDVDDLAYIRGLIEEAAATYSIDVSRIGLFGHSNGGFMALRMACEASDLVTSVVSLAGATFDDVAMCEPATNPVSVLTLHGTADETVLYDGRFNGDSPHPGALETIERFAEQAGCDTANPVMLGNRDLVENLDGSESTVLSYSDCETGAEVELWTIVEGSHVPFPWVPSGLDSFVDWLLSHQREN